jgi:hypothetical protein
MTHASSLAQKATVGALLLIVPVAAQLFLPIGDLWWGHLLFAAAQLAGWALLASTCIGISTAQPSTVRSRGGRIGHRLVLAGCVLQMLFALTYGGSVVVTGEPFGGSFVLFLLGFLALLVGGVVWGLVVRRGPGLRLAGNGLLATAVLGFVAIAAGDNVVHEIALLSSYAAWILVAVGVDTTDPRDVIRPGVPGDQRV